MPPIISTENDIIIQCILFFAFLVVNLPRVHHCIQKLRAINVSWIRKYCNLYDLSFTSTYMIYAATSIALFCFSLTKDFHGKIIDCIIWLDLNFAIYILCLTLLILFSRARLNLFVFSTGNWLKLPFIYDYLNVLLLLFMLSAAAAIISINTLFFKQNISICEYSDNHLHISIFLFPILMISFIFITELYIFVSLIIQCKAICNSFNTNVAVLPTIKTNFSRMFAF